MKWKTKKPIKEGIIRIVKRFAFFPITEYLETKQKHVRTQGETRWLETVFIKQKRVASWDMDFGSGDYWTNYQFVTETEYEKYLNS